MFKKALMPIMAVLPVLYCYFSNIISVLQLRGFKIKYLIRGITQTSFSGK